MDEQRKQFEEWIKAERPKLFLDLLETYPTRYSDPSTERLWQAWQASRQAQSIVAYLTHQGSAVSPDDFEGGEAEMHETAKREEWAPLVKKGE
ncbi:hypothetical protein [Rosenbergiella epipactidis]|uniref:hypothetical protein n=1 Tax=Rosenbergiella epipactidis TaxID=1544694 RepID=UPI001F4F5969|nr:hypothetical protein [Rosenbergiella epipactidis]